jgi:hypothetical protein
MTVATDKVVALALSLAALKNGLAADLATVAATPDVALDAAAGVAPEVMEQLALVISTAEASGLSGVDSEQASGVVEAVETVKAWADSVSVEATAVLVAAATTTSRPPASGTATKPPTGR